jgi:O-antigen/teichoic acid export membrane protein
MNTQQRLGKNTAWMSLAASGMSLVSFLVFIIISRILAAEEIGLVVFAMLVVETGKILINGGLSIGLVQRRDWQSDYSSTCFYLSFVYGLIITGTVLLVGVPLTERFYDPAAAPVLQVLSLIFMLEAIKVVHEGKLRREQKFKVIAMRSIITSIASGIVGVTMAIKGYGIWALVAQQVSGQILITLVTIISAHWRPSWSFSFARAREALTFSAPMMLAQLINTLCNTLVEFMVGIILGPIALGTYRIAGRALFILQDIIIRPLEQTTLPTLARLEEKIARANATLRIMRMSNFVILPIFLGTAAVAPEFIEMVFGEKWRTSGELMSLLAIGSTPLVLRLQVNSALAAEGKSNWVAANMLITLITTITVGYLMIPFGVNYAAIAYIIINYISSAASLIIFYQLFRINLWKLLQALYPSHLAAGVMLLICLLVKQELPHSFAPILAIIIICIVGGISYLAMGLFIFRKETNNFILECLNLLPKKFSPPLLRLQGWLRLS